MHIVSKSPLLAGLLLFIIFYAGAAPKPATAQRAKYNFNSEWKVQVGDPAGAEAAGYNDASWKQVTLPWAWNEDEAFREDIHDLTTGVAWYRKTFTLPAGAKGKKVFLEFEGVRQAGEFYVNGRHFGRHENGAMAVGFDIKWEAGTISAISYDGSGKKVSEAKHETAGKPEALRLSVMHHPDGMKANGHDLALVEVEVVDAKGNRCPTALNMVNFSLDGPAEWRGGIAQGPDNYILSKDLQVKDDLF